MMEKTDIARIKKVLWHWGRCDKRISELIDQMRIAKSCMDDLYTIGGSPRTDGMPHGTAVSDPVMREYERIEKARQNFRDEIEACEKELLEEQRLKAAVNDCLKQLPGLEQDIIRMKYKGRHTVVYIAAMCGVVEKTVYNREIRALIKLDKLITTA